MDLLLTSLLLVPFFGAAVGAFLQSGKAARTWALLVSLIVCVLTIVLAANFFPKPPISTSGVGPISRWYTAGYSPELVKKLTLSTMGFSINLGVDAVAMWMVILTAFLMPLSIAASFGSIKDREKEYYA